MKGTIALLLGAAVAAQADTIHFQLSPPGTDVAVGLSPSNCVPAVTNSTGSGDAISGGIVFDTDTQVLQLAIGYGSAAGFTDLSGATTAMHIHGPAAPGESASPIVDLSPYNFPAADATKGGVIVGNIAFSTNSVSNLLAGLTYVNIHTALNPAGEIRGQLIPVTVTNSPTVVWTLNGAPLQTNTLPAQTNPVVTPVTFMGELPLGTNIVGITVADTATNTTSCTTTVTVVDTIPPVINSVSANPNVLWPPNHKMINVTVRANVTDSCSTTTWRIISVTSNEPVNGLGDGDTAPDWQITGAHTLKLRAERSGRGHGRVYTITIQAQDTSGNTATAMVAVSVPHDRGHH